MDRRELIGPEHLSRVGTRQEEGVGILPLSARFLLFCAFFFFLIPRSNQEVIGISKVKEKKQSNEDGKQVGCQIRTWKMAAAVKMSMGLGGGRGGLRDERRNTGGDKGTGGSSIRSSSEGSTRGRMLWFIQYRRGGQRGQGVLCPQQPASVWFIAGLADACVCREVFENSREWFASGPRVYALRACVYTCVLCVLVS